MVTRQIAAEPPEIVCMCFIYLCIYIQWEWKLLRKYLPGIPQYLVKIVNSMITSSPREAFENLCHEAFSPGSGRVGSS